MSVATNAVMTCVRSGEGIAPSPIKPATTPTSPG